MIGTQARQVNQSNSLGVRTNSFLLIGILGRAVNTVQ